MNYGSRHVFMSRGTVRREGRVSYLTGRVQAQNTVNRSARRRNTGFHIERGFGHSSAAESEARRGQAVIVVPLTHPFLVIRHDGAPLLAVASSVAPFGNDSRYRVRERHAKKQSTKLVYRKAPYKGVIVDSKLSRCLGGAKGKGTDSPCFQGFF